MRVIIEPNYDLMSQWAANYVVAKINAAKPTAEKPFVLGLPTGSSPIGMYRALVKAYQEGKVSFKNVVTFNMDEYVALPVEHPESYHSFITSIAPRRISISSTAMLPTSLPSVLPMRRRLKSLVVSTSSWEVLALMVTSPSTSRAQA